MHKIQVADKNFILLDHQKLINEAYGEAGYQLRPELFEFHPKEYKSKKNEFVPRKKRKKSTTQSSHLQEVTEIIKTTSNFLPQTSPTESQFEHQSNPFPRFWEQISAKDFPKFKGANNTTSFQIIDNLINGDIKFVIPPKCRFYNYDITEILEYINELSTPFDVIVLDPPWRNKYIRRLKRHQLGYNMLDSKQLEDIPIGKLINEKSVVLIWCTNSKKHHEDLLNFISTWQLRLIHTLKWLKLNTLGEPIAALNEATEYDDEKQYKKPFEMLFICCHRDAVPDYGAKLKEVEMLMSIPSIIHSHKPPLLPWLRDYFNLDENPKCLELFARYLQPNFTSFGLEVVKLMDSRLYNTS